MKISKNRRLAVLSSCLVLAAGCSSQADRPSDSDAQSTTPVICQGACVYQSNLDDTCAAGPQPNPDGWQTICMDLSCGDVSTDPMGSFDPISACATSLVYRGWRRFGGTCDDWYALNLKLPEAGLEPEGIACESNADCASNNCVGTDTFEYFCANACQTDSDCSVGFACKDGYCVPPCLQ